MAEKEQILIEVQFDASTIEKAQKALQANLNALSTNKKELAELNKQVAQGNALTEEGAKRYATLNKDIEENKRAIKSNTAIIQAATMAKRDENDSLDAQRQYLNTLQKAFAGLTAEQKEAMGGQEALENAIKAVSDSLKEQEHAIGEDGRNVGNYAEAVTKAFGDMAHAGELISPAVGLLRGMGGEGQKAAAALDALGKVMQLAGKAGNVFAKSQQAQQVATEGATIAQNGLNTAMAANPIGLVVAGIATLLPLIQQMISAFGDCTNETEAFNRALETQSKLLEQVAADAEYEAQVAAIFGASQKEQTEIRRKAALENVKTAQAEVDRLVQIRLTGSRKERKAAEEALEKAQEQLDNANKALDKLNEQATLNDLKAKKAAEDEKLKIQEEGARQRREARQKEADEQTAQERELGIQLMEARLTLLQMQAQEAQDEFQALQEQSQQLLESLNEDEEEDEILSPDEMAKKMFGLDQEGVDYFNKLLAEGVKFAEAKTKAIAEQTTRMTKSFGTAFGALGKSFSDMGNMLGEFAEESAEASALQKGFAFTGIMLSQAQSIANGALAISEGVASAAELPFPANIPAIITIVAQIAALMAGVGSSIAQAKQVFAQADAGKFADGGIVGGTSYNGDKLTAHVNSREMILPMDAQKALFDTLSSAADGRTSLGIDYEMMAAANAALPAPVVVYKELQDFGDKVSTFDELASI